MTPSPLPEPARMPNPGRSLTCWFVELETPLLAFAYQLVKNETIAQDVVQEAFMRLSPRLAGLENPRGWLYTTVRHLAIDHIRASRKIVPMPRTADGSEVEPTCGERRPPELAEDSEHVGLLRVCLERLEARDRQLVVLKYVEDLSYKEIAERMQLTIGNVGYRLHHALASLHLELEKEGVTR